MPASLIGRISAGFLFLYIVIFIGLVVWLFQGGALGVIIVVINVGIFIGLPVGILSLFAFRKETFPRNMLPVLSFIFSLVYLIGFVFFIFIWSFGD